MSWALVVLEFVVSALLFVLLALTVKDVEEYKGKWETATKLLNERLEESVLEDPVLDRWSLNGPVEHKGVLWFQATRPGKKPVNLTGAWVGRPFTAPRVKWAKLEAGRIIADLNRDLDRELDA